MATIESIQNAYIDYVLTEGSEPKSVYIFAKQNEMTEAEFYQLFGSFDHVLRYPICSGRRLDDLRDANGLDRCLKRQPTPFGS